MRMHVYPMRARNSTSIRRASATTWACTRHPSCLAERWMDLWRHRRRVGRSSAFSVGERRSPYPTKSHYRDLTRANVRKGCTYDGKARTQGGWPGSRCATTFQAAVARAHSVSVIGWTCNVARFDGVEASRKGGLGQRPAVITWHSQKGRGRERCCFLCRPCEGTCYRCGCIMRGLPSARLWQRGAWPRPTVRQRRRRLSLLRRRCVAACTWPSLCRCRARIRHPRVSAAWVCSGCMRSTARFSSTSSCLRALCA